MRHRDRGRLRVEFVAAVLSVDGFSTSEKLSRDIRE